MIIKSYSKINLSLRILNKKKKNRLHDIETNSVLVNLHDKIDIKRNKKDIIMGKNSFNITEEILKKVNELK